MKIVLLISALLLPTFGTARAAVDCEMARKYAAMYTKEQLAELAKASGIEVTKARQAEYAQCFKKRPNTRRH